MKRSEERVKLLAGVFCLCAFVCYAATRQYCTRYMPEIAGPEVGRTIPLEANYGKTVYLTGSESHYVDLAYGIAALFGAAAVATILVRSWQAFKAGMDEKRA